MPTQARPSVQPWTPGDMAGPCHDFWTLAAPGTQVLLGDEWRTVAGMLPCATGAHGSMCGVFLLDNDWEDRLLVHMLISEKTWLRQPIEVPDD